MLTRAALPFRNLRHFGAANLLIVLGVMVGTAVLTGALLLGDSLKGSLADLTLDRLGQIDAALMTDRFFPASVATRLAEASPGQEITPAVILRGTVLRRSEDGSKVLTRAGQVQVVGVEPRFWKLFGENREDLPSDAVLINQALADALQSQPRDGLEVRVEKPQRVPAESVLGKRSEDAALVIETSKLAGVLPDRGAGRFTLLPRQESPLILYVQLERLQRRLTRDQQLPAGSVNVLLAGKSEGQVEKLENALARVVTFEDLGFTLRKNADGSTLVLESGRMLLEPAAVKAVEAHFERSKFRVTPVLTYLANRTYRTDQITANGQPSGPFVPYSAISGLARVGVTALGEDEVVINDFVAQDLWPGSDWATLNKPMLRIEYFVETEGHRLREATHDLKVTAIVPSQGIAADRTLTPEFPGMKTSRIADWNPPFPRDQWHSEWIRPRDEEYYRQHRATPKLFVHPNTAEKLFTSRFGSSTSLRIGHTGALTPADEQAIRDGLTAAVRPADFGLSWQAVKAQGLQAATQGGTTNMFGGLFAGFSMFLIVSAALLVGLLFRLRIERRAREIGLLLATGWPVAGTRRLFLIEGLVLAVAGALLGLPAALAYAWLMIQGLRAGWGGLLASDSLGLHVGPLSLAAGAVASVLIALIAIVWSLRGLVRQPVPVLLAGRSRAPSMPGKRRSWTTWLPRSPVCSRSAWLATE